MTALVEQLLSALTVTLPAISLIGPAAVVWAPMHACRSVGTMVGSAVRDFGADPTISSAVQSATQWL